MEWIWSGSSEVVLLSRGNNVDAYRLNPKAFYHNVGSNSRSGHVREDVNFQLYSFPRGFHQIVVLKYVKS
jgi:hypothetical protein